MAKEDKILQQTRSSFRAVGYITGVERENFYRSGVLEKGKSAGKEFRSLSFGVKVSDTQVLYVGMFGIEPEFVYVFDNKAEDPKKRMERVEYDEWYDKHETWSENGKICLDTNISLQETGRDAPRLHLPTFDAVDELYSSLENGMKVYVSGDISRNSYTSQSGENVTRTNYNVRTISLYDGELDFSSPTHRSRAEFTEEFVLVDTMVDKEEEKLVLIGKTIDYAEKTYDVTYDVNYSVSANHLYDNLDNLTDEQKEETDKYAKEQVELKKAMAKAFKSLPFGTLLKCDGDIINKVVIDDSEDDVSDDKVLNALRGNSKPTAKAYIRSMSIEGTQEYVAERYTEKDFLEAVENSSLVKEDPLAGNSKRKTLKDEVEDTSLQAVEIDDDDLPF